MKRIYFLFGTALLLCCLVNFNVAQAQTEAVATWPLTEAVEGTATTSGNISAADESLHNLELAGYTGTNNSQRIRVLGNEWPVGITDTLAGTYVEFTIAPNAGNAFTANSISYEISSAGTGKMSARAFYSTDPAFTTATEIPNGSGAADYNVPRDNEADPAVLTQVEATNLTMVVNAGETMYVRIYPWMNDAAEADGRSGKYIYLQNLVVSGTTTEGTACEPSATTLYHQVDADGGWNGGVDATTLDPGQTLLIGPHPNVETGWSWTGPNGFTATTREITPGGDDGVEAADAGVYVGTYTNDCGATSTATFTLTVNGTDPGTGAVNVFYVTSNKEMAEGASDPILAMLQEDDNLNVTLFSIAGDSTVDLSGADVIVAQEGFGSGDAIWMPGGPLALATLPAPTVYNKTYALRDGKAVVSGGGTSAEVAGVAITVPAANQDHELFNGITLTDNAFNVFDSTADDSGGAGTKALNYTYGLTLSADNTLVGTAAETTDADSTVFLNIIPAGTTVGDQVVGADMVMMGMNFGAISRGGNNMTTEGLTLWRNAVYMLAGLEVPETPVGEEPVTGGGNIVFITDDENDAEQIEWLEGQGFNVTTYYNAALSTAPQADIDMLNAADLVIIGRSGSSGDFGANATTGAADKAAWNGLTVPVILNSNWISRTSRLNWFVQAEGSPVHMDTINITIDALILEPGDPVFSDATLGADNMMPWTVTPEDFLYVTDPGNANVLATSADTDPAGAILFARFDANEEFYTGSVDMPAAERVFFVFGNDHADDEAGADIINFFPLTPEARQVYLNEIMRFTGEPGGGTTVSVASNPTPADDAEDVDTDGLVLTWEGDAETYNVYWGTSADNMELAENGEGLTTATFSPASIAEGTEYFWRVDAMAEGAETAVGPVWSFTTAGEPSNVATLADLTINGTTITGFDAATGAYTMNLPAGTTSVEIGAETTDAGASVSGAETLTLEEGENTHTVVVTAADGTTMEYTITFVVAPTKVTGLAAEGVEIYPNPVNGNSTLNLRNAKELVSVNVYTAQGVLVRTITAGNSGNISIQVSDLSEGLYLLKAVKQDRSVLTGKFVK